MADDDAGEKSEEPTSKKRSDAREEGNIPKSAEINTVLLLLSAFTSLRIFMPSMGQKFNEMLLYYYRLAGSPSVRDSYSIEFFHQTFIMGISFFFRMFLPVALIVLFFGILANLLQVGFLFTVKPLEPKLSKLNPISGFKRLFSLRAVVDTVKNIMKLIIIGTVAYLTIRSAYSDIMGLVHLPLMASFIFMLRLAYSVVVRVILTLFIVAALDYGYQRFDHTKKLKMTKQEVKEEYKQSEGDPKVKGRIRQLQREMAQRRMMAEVPNATVVITNPTHLSIAILYNDTMDTPKVVAKGADNIALKIREVAKENKVPLVEDVPLARGMYNLVEAGDDIPYEFFNAVAEVLAYVYKMEGKI